MNEMPTLHNASYAMATSNSVIASPQEAAVHARVTDFLRKGRQLPDSFTTTTDEEMPVSNRRFVRVFMVDLDEDVPVESALLYDSKEVFTDKTDQELFFDMPMTQLLEQHNAKRVKFIDKSIKDRTAYLEPARIRDLKMVVVDLVKF